RARYFLFLQRLRGFLVLAAYRKWPGTQPDWRNANHGLRVPQALHMLALAPVAETRADRNSYGFREGRCCADAIGQCFIALAKSYAPVWVLEGDIKNHSSSLSGLDDDLLGRGRCAMK